MTCVITTSSDVVRAMMAIHQPPGPAEYDPEELRRLIETRADDVRRELAPGEKRHKKSTKPLSPARIARMFAVPRVSTVRPLPWARPPTEAFAEALRKQVQAASESAGPGGRAAGRVG